MVDREKVIKGLKCCSSMCGVACRKCPYNDECMDVVDSGVAHLSANALELLKEQQETIKSLYGTINRLLFSNVHEEGEVND